MTKKTTVFLHILCTLLLFGVLLTAGCGRRETADTRQVDTLPMLVMQIQKCSRLYTTEYRVHKIVTHDDVVRLRGRLFSSDYDLPLPIGERKVAIPMDATLKAYIDFSTFTAEHVSRQGRRIVVTLPDPRVVMTESKIDQEGIREYVALMRSHFSDRELSSYERQGREAILQSIPRMGIVESARLSAARLLIPIITQLGYDEQDIVITFRRDFSSGDIRQLLDKTTIEK